MEVKLISYTADAEALVATAAKRCYTGVDTSNIGLKLTDKTVARMARALASSGHTPVEHAVYTFSIDGISRATMAQLTRHRIASFNVESQRYVDHTNFDYVTPPAVSTNEAAKATYDMVMDKLNETYKALINMGIRPEDARYILPNACTTRVICTFNARSLMHFFNLRCCTRAQWEIRELANLMLAEVKKVSPNIFADAGASCIQWSRCPEPNPCKEGFKNGRP